MEKGKRVVKRMSEESTVTPHIINSLYEKIDSLEYKIGEDKKDTETRLRLCEERGIKSDGIIERCVESNDKLSNMIEKFNCAIIDMQLAFKDLINDNKNNKQYTESVEKKVDEKISEINIKIDEKVNALNSNVKNINDQIKVDNDKNKIDLRDVQKEVNTNWLKDNWGKLLGGAVGTAICGILIKLIDVLSQIKK